MYANVGDILLRVVKHNKSASVVTYEVVNRKRIFDVRALFVRYDVMLKHIDGDDCFYGAFHIGDVSSISIGRFNDATRIESAADLGDDFFVYLSEEEKKNLDVSRSHYRHKMMSLLMKRNNLQHRV